MANEQYPIMFVFANPENVETIRRGAPDCVWIVPKENGEAGKVYTAARDEAVIKALYNFYKDSPEVIKGAISTDDYDEFVQRSQLGLNVKECPDKNNDRTDPDPGV